MRLQCLLLYFHFTDCRRHSICITVDGKPFFAAKPNQCKTEAKTFKRNRIFDLVGQDFDSRTFKFPLKTETIVELLLITSIISIGENERNRCDTAERETMTMTVIKFKCKSLQNRFALLFLFAKLEIDRMLTKQRLETYFRLSRVTGTG